MLPLNCPRVGSRPLRVLCIGAHADDIEIGCGGTLLSLTGQTDVAVHWVVLSADGARRREAEASAELFLAAAQARTVSVASFRTSFFPYQGEAIKDHFETLKGAIEADLVLTHYRHDLHQDHRLVSELTWNTFRDHLILEYEIPKYDGDLGAPNVFVPLDRATCERKVQYLLRSFATQRDKHWFTRDVFLSLLRLRGMEARAPSGFAEAFYGRKLTLGTPFAPPRRPTVPTRREAPQAQ
jgi:LmbE family N-acetylglucosaminyl deacetylase